MPTQARERKASFDVEQVAPRGSSTPGSFDFYVLSLSWSPGFCATKGDARDRSQCRSGADIGFTLHGLWPQYDHGFPSDCGGQTRLSRSALATGAGLYPDERLARYEWRRHGTCSGLDPNAYFSAARRARAAVKIPATLQDPHRPQILPPQQIERDFIDANSGLHPDMLAAICRDGTLEEVRICFSKDLDHYRSCPQVVRSRCRAPSIIVPAVN